MKTTTLMASALVLAAGAALAQDSQSAPVDLAIFPEAQAGYTRHVFQAAPNVSEDLYKIEVVAGQTMSVDCNIVMVSADFEEETLEGWGYNYYVIEDVSQPASTMMGCPDTAKTDQFIAFNMDDDALLRYNSRMPIVVYAPENLTVGYRIWQTDGVLHGQAE